MHDALGDRYPRLLVEQQTVLTAGPVGVNTEVAPQYRLTDLDASWSVVFGAEHLTVETSKYTNWAEARSRFEEALMTAAEVATIRVAERTGLRYVNHLSQASLQKQLRPELLGPLRIDEFRSGLLSSVSQHLMREENTVLAVRTGLTNTEGSSNPFLLDIDVSGDNVAPFQTKMVLDQLDNYNDIAFRFFIWSVTENYYLQMRDLAKDA